MTGPKGKGICRHCKQPRWLHKSRMLCKKCYGNPDIRPNYPTVNDMRGRASTHKEKLSEFEKANLPEHLKKTTNLMSEAELKELIEWKMEHDKPSWWDNAFTSEDEILRELRNISAEARNIRERKRKQQSWIDNRRSK